MARLCRGAFSEETKRKLKEAFDNCSIPIGTCATCGRGKLVGKNYGVEWLPETHTPLTPYRSGKRTGDKR